MFELDGEPPPVIEAEKNPVQLALFPVYVDVQRTKRERYVEPSLMDYLADHPRE